VGEAVREAVQGAPAIGLVLGLEPVDELADGHLLNPRDDGAALCSGAFPQLEGGLRVPSFAEPLDSRMIRSLARYLSHPTDPH